MIKNRDVQKNHRTTTRTKSILTKPCFKCRISNFVILNAKRSESFTWRHRTGKLSPPFYPLSHLRSPPSSLSLINPLITINKSHSQRCPKAKAKKSNNEGLATLVFHKQVNPSFVDSTKIKEIPFDVPTTAILSTINAKLNDINSPEIKNLCFVASSLQEDQNKKLLLYNQSRMREGEVARKEAKTILDAAVTFDPSDFKETGYEGITWENLEETSHIRNWLHPRWSLTKTGCSVD